jgi:phosphoserine phosphatase RsbU/P
VARVHRFSVAVCSSGRLPARHLAVRLSSLRRALILTLLVAIASPLLLHAQFLAVPQLGGPVEIAAPWRFHTGDNPQWASPDFDDSQWSLLRMDKPWNVQGYAGFSGYAWYRIRLQLPAGKEPLALGFSFSPGRAEEIYADGKSIGVVGRMRPIPEWVGVLPKVFPLPASLYGRTIELAIRLWLSPIGAAYQGAQTPPLPILGTEEAVRASLDLTLHQVLFHQYLSEWFVDIVALVIGQISFGLFLLRPRAREYLWAGLYLFGQAAIAGFFLYCLVRELPAKETQLAYAFMQAGVWVCWLLLAWGFMRARADWPLRAGILVALTPPLYTSLTNRGLITIPEWYVVHAVVLLCIGVLIFIRLMHEAWKGNRDAQIFLLPFLLNSVMATVAMILTALYWLGLYRSEAYTLNRAPALYRGAYFTVTWDQLCALLSYLAIGAVLVRRFTRSAEQEQRLATEMESARQVQAQLVPSEFPRLSGFRIEAAYLPAAEVGGDFYQVFEQNDGSVVLVIGDVCGKGLKAAMTGVLAIGAARTLASEQLSPGLLLTRFNKQMVGSQNGGFITCICARISREGAVVLANAGHLPPYRNGEEIQVASGLPLGITPEVEYGEICVQLAPGDSLTFLSDGVIEARGKAEEFFGFERAQEISRQSAQAIANAAQRFGQEDDITVLTLAYSPSGAAS